MRGHADVVKVLVDNGADVDLFTEVSSIDIDMRYPMFYVSLSGQIGSVPLGVAAENGFTDVVDTLLKARANVNHKNKVHTYIVWSM